MNRELPDVQAGFTKGRGTRDQIANICWITENAREFQKNIYFCLINYAKPFDCVGHNKLWKILRDGNTRPPNLPPENSVCMSRSNSQNWTWNNRMVQNWERSISKLYIVTMFIYLTYMQSTSCEMLGWMNHKLDQDCWEKYQEPQICRWHHPYGRKQRKTKEPLDESGRGEWKSSVRTQYSEN